MNLKEKFTTVLTVTINQLTKVRTAEINAEGFILVLSSPKKKQTKNPKNSPVKYFPICFEGNLMKHMTNAHDESRSKTVPCPQCDKMCYDQENLRKHMASHSGK